jgi:hypothetical protein
VIEDNRALLRAKYEEAKELGARAGAAKAAISAAKAQLEQLRAQRAVAGEGRAEGCVWEWGPGARNVGWATTPCAAHQNPIGTHSGQ